MIKKTPPAKYEDLTRVIHDTYDRLSKSHKKIALFLTQNPNGIAVESVNSLSKKCGVHASSFVRFAQLLGYSGFKEMQIVFRTRFALAAPGFEARIEALRSDLATTRHRGAHGYLADLVVRDITALEDLLVNVTEDLLESAIDHLERAHTIYLVGQLRSSPVVDLLRYLLTMLGKPTVLLDPGGGLATHMADLIQPEDVLFAVSFRFYATEVVNITENVAARGVPIIGISDSTLSPLAKSATVLFAVPEHEYSFSRTLAAPMCLAQALMTALAARLQKTDKPTLQKPASPQP